MLVIVYIDVSGDDRELVLWCATRFSGKHYHDLLDLQTRKGPYSVHEAIGSLQSSQYHERKLFEGLYVVNRRLVESCVSIHQSGLPSSVPVHALPIHILDINQCADVEA